MTLVVHFGIDVVPQGFRHRVRAFDFTFRKPLNNGIDIHLRITRGIAMLTPCR